MKLIKFYLLIFAVWVVSVYSQEAKDRYLSNPQLAKCKTRFMEAKYQGRNFFYSGHDPELKDTRLDWLDSRNTCRDRCMETVSFETQEKFDFFKEYIANNKIPFVWTSGRICDFDGCEGRWDLLPKRIKGWLWSANQVQLADTNKTPPDWSYQPWSKTGVRKKPQPDNAEFYLSQTSESCLGVLNNMYNDSVSWHDIACYHKSRFICEDSEALYQEALELSENGNSDVVESTSQKTTTTTKKTVVTTRFPQPATTTKKVEIAEKIFPSRTRNQNVDNTKLAAQKVPSEEKGKEDISAEEQYEAGNINSPMSRVEEVFTEDDYLDSTDDEEAEYELEARSTVTESSTTTTTEEAPTTTKLRGRYITRKIS